MIPILPSRSDEGAPILDRFAEALSAAGFAGELERGDDVRTVFSTDNSIYQVRPAAVAYPRGADDLVRLARTAAAPAFRGLSIAMRGGATGTNGQSLSAGVVVDASRHMNRILSIDPERRVAVVEAGVVKDRLNQALKAHGLFFAPELSTSNRATIGGMVSTDACGQGSCLYGKTSNHVLGLRVVLADGTDWQARPLEGEALAREMARPDRVGEILRVADAAECENRDEIRRVFPPLNRFLTGYDLAHLRTGAGGLDPTALLCGSEGTLAMIAEVELNLLPIPRRAALLVVRYDDFDLALRDAHALAPLGVASVETIDATVLSLARRDIVWNEVGAFFPDDGEAGPAQGVNIVEVLAEDKAGLDGEIGRVRSVLDGPGRGRRGYTLARRGDEIRAIWGMRKRAVGLLGNVEGPRRPLPFVEDAAVPPERLADFVAEFRALLDAEGLDYGMFGHVDAGVLHVRPALDLSDPAQEPLVRRITDAVAALARRHGGVLWGEHGKGMRSEYVPAFFGSLYPQLQRIKAAFDPFDQLNPGKIARADGGPLTRIDEPPLRGQFDRAVPRETRASFAGASTCNGNGACFDFEADSAMCPSFKGTGDRRQSPKGRAMLVREWLRRLGEAGADPLREAEALRARGTWRRFPARLASTWGRKGRADFSHEVKRAMDTCLACKACAGQCPVKVNVPAFRSRFLELYHGRYLRPPRDLVVSRIETVLPLAARLRPLYNALVRSRAGQAAMAALGLTALPQLTSARPMRELRRAGARLATPAALAALSEAERARSVVFVQDAFTSFFDTELVLDAVALARRLGFTPFVAPLMANGKALHVHGRLGAFARTAARTAEALRALGRTGVPLVGIDPSMTLCYRSEYVEALGPGRAPAVQLPQEWLAAVLAADAPPAAPAEGEFVLLPHCTERTNAAGATEAWGAVFARFGLRLRVETAGCCGMAGTFGHERRNRPLSERIYALSWQGKLAHPADGSHPMASGYSCRSQAALIDGRKPPHPLQVLARHLAAASTGP